MKKNSYKHFNNFAKYYTKLYNEKNFSNFYPANNIRFKIVSKLLSIYSPKKIVDAGCGAGLPLIDLKKKGFNIIGYDKSKEMVKEAKKNLKKNKLSENLIFLDDFEKTKKIKKKSVDCIIGLGAFYYSRNFIKTMKNQISQLKNNGRIIFSLRNELFDLSTFNNYSKNFFSKLYNINSKNKNYNKFTKLFKGYKNISQNFQKNIDQKKVYSSRHNPLNISNYLKDKLNLNVNNIYFYHYHCLPPFFEKENKINFRKESFKIENPNSWKGYFLASAFILDCKKNEI